MQNHVILSLFLSSWLNYSDSFVPFNFYLLGTNCMQLQTYCIVQWLLIEHFTLLLQRLLLLVNCRLTVARGLVQLAWLAIWLPLFWNMCLCINNILICKFSNFTKKYFDLQHVVFLCINNIAIGNNLYIYSY